MPVPNEIKDGGDAFLYLGAIKDTIPNPNVVTGSRRDLSRTFHAYLEVGYQSKHDSHARAYCLSKNLTPRRSDQSQVRVNKNAKSIDWLKTFYLERARTAVKMTIDHMCEKWSGQQTVNTPVFTAGNRVDVSEQSVVQPDNFQYETSYYYDGPEIYVTFHCYPAR